MQARITAALTLLFTVALQAQSPAVAKYIKTSSPRILLTHVRVIDGTGAAATEDQNNTEHQTITRMNAAIFNSTKAAPRSSSKTSRVRVSLHSTSGLGLQYDGDRMQPCLVTAGSESSATR
jgi:hypothetical protein